MKLIKTLFHRFSLSNKKAIESLISSHYSPDLLEIVDESAKHYEASDSHFRVYIVSDMFQNKSYIKRHREIMNLLKEKDLMTKVHAVSIVARTVEEHANAEFGGTSPNCTGKKEK